MGPESKLSFVVCLFLTLQYHRSEGFRSPLHHARTMPETPPRPVPHLQPRLTVQASTAAPPRAVWYSDPDVGRDRSSIIEMPLEEALRLPSSRFILSRKGEVAVKRCKTAAASVDDDDDDGAEAATTTTTTMTTPELASRRGVDGLFVPFAQLPAEWTTLEDVVAAWVGSKGGLDFWALDLPPAAVETADEVLGIRSAADEAADGGWEMAPMRQFGDRMTSREDAALYATANGMVSYSVQHASSSP